MARPARQQIITSAVLRVVVHGGRFIWSARTILVGLPMSRAKRFASIVAGCSNGKTCASRFKRGGSASSVHGNASRSDRSVSMALIIRAIIRLPAVRAIGAGMELGRALSSAAITLPADNAGRPEQNSMLTTSNHLSCIPIFVGNSAMASPYAIGAIGRSILH
jgi:hypothetical protein